MLRLEERIASQVLKRVRSRRAAAAEPKPQPALSAVRLREVEFDDCSTVTALKRRHGMKQDSEENWRRLWMTNPAISHAERFSKGWVLEADEGVVGYHGSIPLRCFYGGKPLKAAATHGLAVEPGYRAYTRALVSAYVRQKGVDLLLSTSAGGPARQLLEVFKGRLLPQADYSKVLFWVLDPHSFLSTVQSKLHLNGRLPTIGRHIGAHLLRVEQAFRRRYPRASSSRYDIRELSPSAISSEFDGFWQKKMATSARLLADRSPETLRWHFDVPGDQRRPTIIRCDCGGRMVGYAVVLTSIAYGTLRKACLVDMLVEDEESTVPQELMVAAFEYARRNNHHVFEVFGFPRSIRQVCMKWNPYMREQSSYLFKAADRDLHSALESENAWYATPYDGDSTLMPEFGSKNVSSAVDALAGIV